MSAMVRLSPRELEALGRLRSLRDKAYRGTPLGLVAGRYIMWKRNEWGATEPTITGYEAVVAGLCLRFGDRPIRDLEPRAGTQFVREFLDDRYGHLSPGTRRKVTSILKDFFRFVVVDAGELHGDPMLPIRRPKPRDVDRQLFSLQEAYLLCAAAPSGGRPDRAAVELLFNLALRKSGLRNLRLGDYDQATGMIRILTKGEKRQVLPVSDAMLAAVLDDHWQARQAQDPKDWRKQYLLYREGVVPTNRPDGSYTDLADRYAPKSDGRLHAWWKERVAAAGVPYRSMHSMRHTRLTQITVSGKGGLKQAQLLAGHESITTTGDIYSHLDVGDLAETLRVLGTGRSAREVASL